MKSILVTGGAGFIGSNFILYILNKYPKYRVINLDLLTYAGNLDNLSDIKNDDRYTFIKGDICDEELVQRIFEDYDIKNVVHFAAESHVDNSIADPKKFIKTNVEGTFTLLNQAYKNWMEKPFKYKDNYENSLFLHISTDEVYGSIINGAFTENSSYAPNSPYSASKASSDLIVRSYNKTYGLNTIITNCSNNFGPRQHSEKFIPTIIKNALKGTRIPVYGNGKNVRDWLYVMDHCIALDLIIHKARSGTRYNIGGDNELENIELVELICTTLDEILPKQTSYKELISFVEDRYGHDKRYAINNAKIQVELGWKPSMSFKEYLSFTIQGYIKMNKGL